MVGRSAGSQGNQSDVSIFHSSHIATFLFLLEVLFSVLTLLVCVGGGGRHLSFCKIHWSAFYLQLLLHEDSIRCSLLSVLSKSEEAHPFGFPSHWQLLSSSSAQGPALTFSLSCLNSSVRSQLVSLLQLSLLCLDFQSVTQALISNL